MTEEMPSNEVVLTEPVAEKTIPLEKFDGLSNREALKESIAYHRDGKEPDRSPTPTTTEVKQAVDTDIAPPSEFNAAEKEAWKAKDISGIQKAYRRVHDARTSELSRLTTSEKTARAEAERERGEAKTWRELGKMAAPYIEARGNEGVSPDKAIMEALALINEFKKGDPATVKAELKRIGIDLDAAPTSTTTPRTLSPEDEALRQTVNELKAERENEKLQKVRGIFDQAFTVLRSQKNRTGEPLFPDLHRDDEAGIEFARRLGSRVRDPFFQQQVSERFPDSDFTTLVREAYKVEYGRVSGEPTPVSTKSNQQHIDKSRRATAANPGRTAPRVDSSNLIGKLSNREAAAKAIEIHRGQ